MSRGDETLGSKYISILSNKQYRGVTLCSTLTVQKLIVIICEKKNKKSVIFWYDFIRVLRNIEVIHLNYRGSIGQGFNCLNCKEFRSSKVVIASSFLLQYF